MKPKNFEGLKILSESEKQNIEEQLEAQFGIKKISGKIAMRGRERIFIYTGNFGENEIKNLESGIFIERIGVYLGKIEESGIRLSIEGTHILGEQVAKNIFEIPPELVEQWMMGHELNVQTGMKGFVVMKYKGEFLGTGKASYEKVSNFIPKNRRLKEKTN